MFKLKRNAFGVRSGELQNGKKAVETPCFFATSNFGGGGTNVSRLLVYSDLIEKLNIELLLNYYYLDINSDLSPRFDTDLISAFESMGDIDDFIQHIKKEYLLSTPKKAASNYVYSSANKWLPLTLLDSGSGNILRNKIKDGTLNKKNYKKEYKKIIEDFFKFIIKHNFDVGIVMDFASKNTFKAGELDDKSYLEEFRFFSDKNFDLLDISLQEMKLYKKINLYVPLHGDSLKEYLFYLNEVLALEKKEGVRFSGFAIGGIGNPSLVDRKKWEISDKVSGRVKAAVYLYKLASGIRTELIKSRDNRPIHILGAASPYNLIPLLLAGIDSFDCHSAWRRASDGNGDSSATVLESLEKIPSDIPDSASFSKILVPLIDKNGKVIPKNNADFLEFVELHKLNNSNFDCDCDICLRYPLIDIKKLYAGNTEENYFAKILIYIHSIIQYPRIINKLKNMSSKKEFLDFINSLPKCQFKKDIQDFLKSI